MHEKKIGEPCPKCAALLIRRPKRIATRAGGQLTIQMCDVAFCASCNAVWELEEPPQHDIAAFAPAR